MLAPDPFTSLLVVRGVSSWGRSTIGTDEVHARLLDGSFAPPADGESWTLPNGQARTWKRVDRGEDGWFRDEAFGGGYAFANYRAERRQVLVLEAAGHTMAYVNGEPRTGDVYSWGNARLPFLAQPGDNPMLFSVARGQLRLNVIEPEAPVTLEAQDPTLPDIVLGIDHPGDELLAGIVVMNSTTEPARGLSVRAEIGGESLTTRLPEIGPLTVREVRVRFPVPSAVEAGKPQLLGLTLDGLATQHRRTFDVGVRTQTEMFKRTFLSAIDDSVQYYAVQPARPLPGDPEPKALVLSVHGASVEATSQANAYSPKRWMTLVAATNRRPYGFDWEDWGRMDALEVLAHARALFKPADDQIYLTGHSMGGHGTWYLGFTYPGKWAAIGPSAGWIHFWSYRVSGDEPATNPMETLLRRAQNQSDVLKWKENSKAVGIYALHGDADDNVPIEQMNLMLEQIEPFHRDLTSFTKEGAGHWWDDDPEPGASCVDWPPMFDLFSRRRIPSTLQVRDVDFATVNPAISSTLHWLTIERLTKPLIPGRAQLRLEVFGRRLVGSTSNIERLSIDSAGVEPGPLTVELDGQTLQVPLTDAKWVLERRGEAWAPAGPAQPSIKSTERAGPFKEAFRKSVTLVYGTAGDPESNRWNYARARYDAEQFWYRGNGAFHLVSDRTWLARPTDGDVIVYGNAGNNAAWNALLADSPVQVFDGRVVVGDRFEEGDDLGVLFVRPRAGSSSASVGVVSGTGVAGIRATERLPYFSAGVHYPDVFVLSPRLYRQGSQGAVVGGFFGNDWSVESGEWVWMGG